MPPGLLRKTAWESLLDFAFAYFVLLLYHWTLQLCQAFWLRALAGSMVKFTLYWFAAYTAMRKKGRFHWLKAILPSDRMEARVLGTVWVVRLLMMPLVSMALVGGLSALGVLPNDPVCHLVLLVEGSMPTAQNLVVLTELSESTKDLTPKIGRMVLRLYPLAILPVTFWMTLFVQRMPVSLAAL